MVIRYTIFSREYYIDKTFYHVSYTWSLYIIYKLYVLSKKVRMGSVLQ